MTARFLALGDSYTIGEGVPAADAWPMQLATRLRQRGLALTDPTLVAVTGWTTDELARGMDNAALAPPYDLVSLLIGVNDQYRGRHPHSYRKPFQQLLNRAVALAGEHAPRVIVVSIPDWGVMPFARQDARSAADIGHALDRYNAAAREMAWRVGALFVDITGISRAHPDEVTDDGLHPSAAQYGRWAERIEPVAWRAAAPGPPSRR